MINQSAVVQTEVLLAHYDLVVIGSGPGGHRAAVQAAKLGKSVLVIERDRLGGSCLHLGTIPSKTMREAALRADGLVNIMERTKSVIEEECEINVEHLRRNKIHFVQGTGSFVKSRSKSLTVCISSLKTSREQTNLEQNSTTHEVTAEKVLIATGTRPRRPAELPFDERAFFDSDSILRFRGQPKNMLVIGAGVIGCEYASIFSRMGIQVTLIDGRTELLGSMDREIVAALINQFEKSGISVFLRTEFSDAKVVSNINGHSEVQLNLTSQGKSEPRRFDVVLYCLGRVGNHEGLSLSEIGLNADARGLISVDSNYQTKVPGVYAVGDIIGAPGLAASSSEQGRLAVMHAFTGQKAEFPDTFPFGIYTIPEISSVGVQESYLQQRGIQYVVGKAPYRVLARGKMLDDEFGFLKLVVHAKTRRIVGVHVIGTSATELVHIGQVAMSFGATVDFFVDNVFNYPTLAEAYKVAAYNATNKLGKE